MSWLQLMSNLSTLSAEDVIDALKKRGTEEGSEHNENIVLLASGR